MSQNQSETWQPSNQEAIGSLRWKKFPVLNDGFVTLVDVMGDDSSVVQAARVSYGKDIRDANLGHNIYTNADENIPQSICDSNGSVTLGLCKDCGAGEIELEEPCTKPGDRNLLRYLMRHRHTTPFEMVELKFLVRVPMDCWRQWIRHRTASVNEYSTRYTTAIDSCQTTHPDEWRLQSGSNKQGSSGFLEEWPKEMKPDGESLMTAGQLLSTKERNLQEFTREVYNQRLEFGVAGEQARKDLPLSTYTEAYWKCNLHNLLHFLGLRMDSHAQQEIREYASTIGCEIVKHLFPMVWEAFNDYRLNAMYMSRLDVEVLRMYIEYGNKNVNPREGLLSCIPDIWKTKNNRELAEFMAKMERIGFCDV